MGSSDFVTDDTNTQASFLIKSNDFDRDVSASQKSGKVARGAGSDEELAFDLEPSWLAQLAGEFNQPYMRELSKFLRAQKRQGKEIYPRGPEMFAALNATPFENVRVVILGQDPYHGPGQAHGLSFSVRPSMPLPPSLRNIFKELSADLGVRNGAHGCLTPWAEQGVLLLNSVLSVARGQAASHQGKGWEVFTDAIIQRLDQEREGVVFLLWGSYAQKKGRVIDPQRHCVLKSPHPSPLSAHRGFLGCRHFSLANEYLVSRGQTPIGWQLPDIMEQ
jgi:uracil-DNA glycosylase